MDRRIIRQDEETEVPELRGARCDEMRAVVSASPPDSVEVVYLLSSGVWHRFFLDAGLLFWEEGLAPDADGDLADGARYVDIAEQLGVRGRTFELIAMKDSVLTIEFSNGARLRLRGTVTEVEVYMETTTAPHR